MLEIRAIKKSDKVKSFLDFICELVDEDTYLLINTKPTLKQEQEWLKKNLVDQNKNQAIFLTVWDENKLVGICSAIKDKWREKNNCVVGISILKKYRGKGLGETLLRQVIKLTKQKLKPKNIYLHVAEANKPAFELYKKVGFKEITRLPNWILHKDKYIGQIIMLLK
ncbi:MAG: GNAT family N-acetyltransferase [Candidatus Micrarchaeota archaeon]